MKGELTRLGDVSPWGKVLALVAAKQAATGKRAIVATAERVTISANKTVSFVDWLAASTTYTQPVAGTQCPEPSTDAVLKRPVIAWNAGTGTYTCNVAKSQFIWMHDGSEVTVYHVLKPTTGPASFDVTTAAFASGAGYDGGHRLSGANMETLMRVRNAAATNWVAANGPGGGLAANTWGVIREEAKANGIGNAGAWTYANGVLTSTGVQSALPVATDPFVAPTLLLSGGQAVWYAAIAIPALLSTAEKQIVSNWTRSLGLGNA